MLPAVSGVAVSRAGGSSSAIIAVATNSGLITKRGSVVPLVLAWRSRPDKSFLVRSLLTLLSPCLSDAFTCIVARLKCVRHIRGKSLKRNMQSNTFRNFALRYWATALAIAVAAFASWIALRYAEQPLLEAQSFRQTQTAITSLWMMKEGWQLAYQTPVAGYPWSIPFEFPLFQSLAALISSLGGWELDPVGRLLSFFFLIACAWPAFSIARRLELPSDVAWIFCALLWSSPIYLFWGRSFMIETAALFFSLAAIPYALDLRATHPRWRSASLFILFASFAMLQKITTAAPVILVLGVMLSYAHVTSAGFQLPSSRKIVCIIASFAIPVFVGALWTRYTDVIKMQNPLGTALTSQALIHWNFGTIEQRADLGQMKALIWDRVIADNAAGLLGVFLLGGTLLVGDSRIKKMVLVSLCLCVLPLFLFTNLHLRHLYYPTSAVVFLLGALAISSTQWAPKLSDKYRAIPVVILLLALSNLVDIEYSRYVFLDPLIENNKAGLIGLAVLLGMVFVLANSRIVKLTMASLVISMTLIMIFTSLHHAYNSNQKYAIVFLIGAVVVSLAQCLRKETGRSEFYPMIIVLLVLTNLYHFSCGYANSLWSSEQMPQPTVLTIGEAILRNTDDDSGIVVFGDDWSSAITYYSRRKSFTVPDWFKKYDDVWLNPAQFLGGKKLGAMVFCESPKIFSVMQIMEQPDVKRQPRLTKIGRCYLWLAE